MKLLWTRRIVQLLFLALWVFLFLAARSPLSQVMRTDLYLMTDPLVALAALGAAQVLVASLLAAGLLLATSLVLGRFFCGWICPLGTLLDGTARLLRPPEQRFSDETHRRMLRWKYWILVLVLAAAVMSFQLAWLLDPLVLLGRASAAALYPAATAVLPADWLPDGLAQSAHPVLWAPLLVLLAVLGLTALAPRFFCRYLCPLGALYALAARLPLLRRRVRDCDGCAGIDASRSCAAECRMGAVPANPRHSRSAECIRCMQCRRLCHAGAVDFAWGAPLPDRRDEPLDVTRRGFLAAGATGLLLAPVLARGAAARGSPERVVRPPRVDDEDLFLDQYVRCGLCVQACPTQTLQPIGLEAGAAGLWSPAITPRIAGCKPECNACALVCPTEAIPPFSTRLEDKWATKMGTAQFESTRCISYAEGAGCARCIRVCPTRAIVIDSSPGRHPMRPARVDLFRCVGCGLCEHTCRGVVFGQPALTTWAHGRGDPAHF